MKTLFSTNSQKILLYLVSNPSKEQTEKEIQKATNISKAGVNFALKSLVRDGLVQVEKRGKMSFYSVDLGDPIIRQIKVIATLLALKPLVANLKDKSDKVVLFGSASTGTNIEESDIDLFILTNQPKEIQTIIKEFDFGNKIQAVVKKPMDYISLKKKDPLFYDEVSRGLILWQKR